MRYRLRTLLILMALGPPMLASSWSAYREYRRSQENQLWMTITPPLIILEEDELTLGIELPE